MGRYYRVTFWEPGVAFEQMGVYDSVENKVAAFGANDSGDDLADVIDEIERGYDVVYRWSDGYKVRINT